MLSLDTRLVDVFKDEICSCTYNRLYEITVKDLLMMASGFDEDYLFGWQKKQGIGYPDYLKFMFNQELKVKIIALLIKSAIDRYAFNTVKLKKLKMVSNEDKVAETITFQLSEGNFDEILDWVTSDKRIMGMLIENHIDLYYQGDSELTEAYSFMTSKHPKTKEAIEQLYLKLDLQNNKQR